MKTLSQFANQLRELPRTVAIKVAAEVAPEISKHAKESFDNSQDAYGNAWAPGVDGQRVTLRKTGALESKVFYVAIGTKLRVTLGVPYAKYQIGKRPIFPVVGLPAAYVKELTETTTRIVSQLLD